MMFRTLIVAFGLIALGAGLGAAQWVAGAGDPEPTEGSLWTPPPRPAAGEAGSVFDRLSRHAVFAISPAEGPAQAESTGPQQPESFPPILSIAVLGGRARAFISADGSAREEIALGDEILGWRVTAISMKGVRVQKGDQEVMLRVFETTSLPETL